MKNQFFSMLSRMKLINRWGLMRNTSTENISEHSHNVAVIAHALAVIRNQQFGGNVNAERVALLGIFHDTTEIITGDLPTPIKYYNSTLREAYGSVEEQAKNKLLTMLPEEMRDIYRPLLSDTEEEKDLWVLVKAADKISALIKCIEERRTGNTDFLDAEHSTLKSIKNMHLKEADYFMSEFLKPYDMTIDDQTQD